MIKNFFRITLRSFLRQRFYSFINIVGLSSGLICALFIFLWISDEVQKDKFHANIGQIYQVLSNIDWEGEIITWEETPGLLAEEIESGVSEVDRVACLWDGGKQLFQVDEKSFLETGYFADPGFFQIFSYPLVHGDASAPLRDKSSVAISRRLAQKLFGDVNPVGKAIRVHRKYDQKVTAVFDDVQSNSSLQFDFIMPFDLRKDNQKMDWGNADYLLYVKLHEKASAAGAIKTINQRANEALRALQAASGENSVRDEDLRDFFYMQPFGERYLNSVFENGVPAGGRIKYVKIFSVVAVFILVIACINFMNMATARAANRGKEVGVRKVIGAQRTSLVMQFIGEALVLSIVAMAVALSATYLLLPFFNVLVSKQLALDFADPVFVAALLSITFITGLLAGSYPAFVLSAFKPARVLKGSAGSGMGGTSLRKVLVTFQFTLTVVLIASVLVIYQQIDFIQQKNLGYNRESVLYFSARAASRNFDTFKHELLQQPGIKNVSRAGEVLVEVHNQNNSVNWQGKPDNSNIFFRTVSIDYDFLETMDMKVVEGRLFAKQFHDTAGMVLTQRAVEVMGLQNPVGQKVSQWGNEYTVVGVVNDFHSRSLQQAIDPVIFICRPQWSGQVHVRIDAAQRQEALAHIEKIYKQVNPEFPFTYAFLDQDFDRLYTTEKVAASLALGFTGMAIIISVLGLLGLAAYTAERRRKEISIRKTLGASVTSLVSMISREFVMLSVIAALVGCAASYYLMQEFLNGYVYHVELSWHVFGVTAISILMITLATVIYQVVKASIANPVDALRNE